MMFIPCFMIPGDTDMWYDHVLKESTVNLYFDMEIPLTGPIEVIQIGRPAFSSISRNLPLIIDEVSRHHKHIGFLKGCHFCIVMSCLTPPRSLMIGCHYYFDSTLLQTGWHRTEPECLPLLTYFEFINRVRLQICQDYPVDPFLTMPEQIGRAHVCTPVTWPYRMPSSPCKRHPTRRHPSHRRPGGG